MVSNNNLIKWQTKQMIVMRKMCVKREHKHTHDDDDVLKAKQAISTKVVLRGEEAF
jgi:hypothetical protein